ncbi:MAG: site-2 protease family protein [Syntrophobacterales bacterium]|jgi:Zn-dependent protease/predicted transcriptional regulator
MADNARERRFSRGISLFKIAGIRIKLDFSWFIIFGLVLIVLSSGYLPRNFPGLEPQTYWLAGLVATLLFFISLTLHELAHSLVAIRHGIDIPEITLFIFGGVSRLSQEPTDPKTEFKIAVVGPLTSFALAAGFWGLRLALKGSEPSLMVVVIGYLAWINLALGIFNLFPGFPLDGGRILRAFLWWKTGSPIRATKVASDFGKGFALVLMILGGLQIFAGALINGLFFIFIGMFLRGMSIQGYEELVIRKSLEGVHVDEVMVREVVSVSPDLTISQLIHDYFLHYAFRGFPVADNGRILGVVSVAAVHQLPREVYDDRRVADIMTPLQDDLLISGKASLADALMKMTRQDQDRLLVLEHDRLAGLVTKTGLLRFVQIKQILEP